MLTVPKLLFHNGSPTLANSFKTFVPTIPKLLFHNNSQLLPTVPKLLCKQSQDLYSTTIPTFLTFPKLLFQLFAGTKLYFHNSCQQSQTFCSNCLQFQNFCSNCLCFKTFSYISSPQPHVHIWFHFFSLSKLLLLTSACPWLKVWPSHYFWQTHCPSFLKDLLALLCPLCHLFPLSKTILPHLPLPMVQSMTSPLLYSCPWLKIWIAFWRCGIPFCSGILI